VVLQRQVRRQKSMSPAGSLRGSTVGKLSNCMLRERGNGASFDLSAVDIELTFGSQGGSSSSCKRNTHRSSIPESTKLGSCKLAAVELSAELAPRLGRHLHVLEGALAELALEEAAALRCCSDSLAFFPMLMGEELATKALIQETHHAQISEALEDVRMRPWTLGGSFLHGLLKSVQQRLDVETAFVRASARCHSVGASAELPKNFMSPEQAPLSQASVCGFLKDVQFRESRASTWVDAADGVLQMLEQQGVERGQVLGIDAHSHDPDEEARFCAYYCLQLPGRGPLGVRYKHVEAEGGEDFTWAPLHDWTSNYVRGRDVISVTAGCNSDGGGVLFCFYYNEGVTPYEAEIVERRSTSWRGVADSLVRALELSGTRKGQVISIDAHHLPGGSEVALSALVTRSLPGRPRGSLSYEATHGNQPRWPDMYAWAAARAPELAPARKDLVSITFSSNGQDSSVGYLFYWQDPEDSPPFAPRGSASAAAASAAPAPAAAAATAPTAAAPPKQEHRSDQTASPTSDSPSQPEPPARPAPSSWLPTPKRLAGGRRWRWSWDSEHGEAVLEPTATLVNTSTVDSAVFAGIDSDGFEVWPGKVTFIGCDVHVMSAVDIAACKRLCMERHYGAFVVSDQKAYFRWESAEKCREYLVGDPRSITYISPGAARPIPKMHVLQPTKAPDIIHRNNCQCFAQ